MVMIKKSGEINIARNLFLEKEELSRFFQFQKDDLSKLLYTINAQSFGVVNTAPALAYNNSYKVGAGTNPGTIKIANDSFAINQDGELLFQEGMDNYPIRDNSGNDIKDKWLWVRIERAFNKYERGRVSVDADGNVAGVNTNFTEVFRGQETGFPTYVSFFQQNDQGELIPSSNKGIYEVVNVIGDNAMIVGGDFTPETNLRIVCMGAWALGQESSALSVGGIYSYNGTKISFVEELDEDYPPVDQLSEGYQFYIARIKWISSTNIVEVQDKRRFSATKNGVEHAFDYYYQLNFGDILVNNKVNLNGDNIPSDFVNAWRSRLNVFSQQEVKDLVSTYAKADGSNLANLSLWRFQLGAAPASALLGKADLDAGNISSPSAANWRNALDVYKKGENSGWKTMTRYAGSSFQEFEVKACVCSGFITITGRIGIISLAGGILFKLPDSFPTASAKIFFNASDGNNDENSELFIDVGSRLVKAANYSQHQDEYFCVTYPAV